MSRAERLEHKEEQCYAISVTLLKLFAHDTSLTSLELRLALLVNMADMIMVTHTSSTTEQLCLTLPAILIDICNKDRV
jgi:hypothetical protein